MSKRIPGGRRGFQMTKERFEVLCLLGESLSGMRCADMAETLDTTTRTLVARLAGMKALGMICKVGVCGPNVLWCLPGQTTATWGKYSNSGTARQKRSRQREREIRLVQVTQRTKPATAPLPFDIPAVNSVWALAA